MKHTKPTPEELEENIKKATEELEELEKLDDKQSKESSESELQVSEEQNDTTTTTEETDSDTKTGDGAEEQTREEEDTEGSKETKELDVKEDKEDQEDQDYKKKFSESSREAQKLYAKNRKLNEAVSEANNIQDLSDDELKKEFPDWDVMNDVERRLAKDNIINKKRFELISKATEESKKIEKWHESVDKFIEDPKTLINYQELEGKEEDFKIYANKQEYNSVPFDLLVKSFIHDMSKKPKAKGKMLETGTGGSNFKQKPKADKISVLEARTLMKRDYKKYTELLKAGKIEEM